MIEGGSGSLSTGKALSSSDQTRGRIFMLCMAAALAVRLVDGHGDASAFMR